MNNTTNSTDNGSMSNKADTAGSCASISKDNPYQQAVFNCIYAGHVNYVFGVIGNILCILAFKKRAKESESYYNQLSVMVNDLFGIVLNVTHEIGYAYLGVWSFSAPKLVKQSFLTFVFINVSTVKSMPFMTSVVLTIGMILDRFYAIYKPVQYNASNRKARAIVLYVCSACFGVIICFPGLLRRVIFWDENKDAFWYYYRADKSDGWKYFIKYSNATMQMTMAFLLALLFVVSAIFCWKYSKVVGEKGKLEVKKYKKDQKEPASQKTLAKMMIAQAVLVFLGIGAEVLYRTIQIQFGVPWCTPVLFTIACFRYIFASTQMSWNFLVYIGVSKSFRKAVLAVVTGRELAVEAKTGAAPSGNTGANAGNSRVAWAEK